jgi:cbb3-type cytochrome oxidase subunit 3
LLQNENFLPAIIIFFVLLSLYFLYKNFRKNQREETDFERSMDLVFLNLSFPIKDSKQDKENDSESV